MNDTLLFDRTPSPSRVRATAPIGSLAMATGIAAYIQASTTKPNVWLGGVECAKGRTFHDGTGRLSPDDLGRST